jgi:sarcosine oxidase subunit delta
MKLMTCPLNGPRPSPSSSTGAKSAPCRTRTTCSDDEWADYVFNRNGAPGVKKEWWCHTPSNTWFIAERDTEKGQVVRTHVPAWR